MVGIHLQSREDLGLGQLFAGFRSRIFLEADNVRLGMGDIIQDGIGMFLGMIYISKTHHVIGQYLQGIFCGDRLGRVEGVVLFDRSHAYHDDQ